MIKKGIIGTAMVAALAALLFGTDALSYVRTSAKKIRHEVKSSVPLDFEIERARNMVTELVPDIRKNMHVIAQEEVEVGELRDQIARAEKNIVKERQELLALRRDPENSSGKFHFSGRQATPVEVRLEMNRRFERFQTAEATLAAKQQMLDARARSLAAARDKLEGMLASKRDLEVQVQNLEARLRLVQAREVHSQFQFDDSQLARCKKSIQDLRKRLDVAEKVLEQDGRLVSELTSEPEAPEDIADRIDRYFGGKVEATPKGNVSL